jgi:hypothetical protein
MAVFELPVRADLPDFTFKQELDGVVYTFNFRFNVRFGYWIWDLSDEVGNPILLGVPVMTDVDIASRFLMPEMPPGQFVVIDESGEQRNPDRTNFGGEVKMFYLDEAEFSEVV